jgi:hypothetical protein
LLAAAQREVEVPGQILIVGPPITPLSVGFGEHPTIGISSDGDTALVDGGVMALTQQDQVANTALNVPMVDLEVTAFPPPLGGPARRCELRTGLDGMEPRRVTIIAQKNPG